MSREYLIEALEDGGRWYILGSDRTSAGAQMSMRDYRRQFPRLALRVVENPSRRIVVLHDPLTDDERAGIPRADGRVLGSLGTPCDWDIDFGGEHQ